LIGAYFLGNALLKEGEQDYNSLRDKYYTPDTSIVIRNGKADTIITIKSKKW